MKNYYYVNVAERKRFVRAAISVRNSYHFWMLFNIHSCGVPKTTFSTLSPLPARSPQQTHHMSHGSTIYTLAVCGCENLKLTCTKSVLVHPRCGNSRRLGQSSSISRLSMSHRAHTLHTYITFRIRTTTTKNGKINPMTIFGGAHRTTTTTKYGFYTKIHCIIG